MFVGEYNHHTTSSTNAKPRFPKGSSLFISHLSISAGERSPRTSGKAAMSVAQHQDSRYLVASLDTINVLYPMAAPPTPKYRTKTTWESHQVIVYKAHWDNTLPECQCCWTQIHMKFHQDLWKQSMVLVWRGAEVASQQLTWYGEERSDLTPPASCAEILQLACKYTHYTSKLCELN